MDWLFLQNSFAAINSPSAIRHHSFAMLFPCITIRTLLWPFRRKAPWTY
jgi:hypothetical protein